MGNRGDIHGLDGNISTRRWRSRRWITCILETEGGYRVTFDTPGHYTPLFFYDEAVALAAGHRPCASCRQTAFKEFLKAWETVHSVTEGSAMASDIDKSLHAARLAGGQQRRHMAAFGEVPSGVFITLPAAPRQACRVYEGSVRPWSHAGYGESFRVDDKTKVAVLTPRPVVEMLRCGYLDTRSC